MPAANRARKGMIPQECDGCEVHSEDVSDVRVDGEEYSLCSDCNTKVALYGLDPEQLGPGETDTIPDPDLPPISIQLIEELPRARRTDYEAVVIDGLRPSDQAEDRGVTTAAVSQNVSNARAQLLELSQEAV